MNYDVKNMNDIEMVGLQKDMKNGAFSKKISL